MASFLTRLQTALAGQAPTESPESPGAVPAADPEGSAGEASREDVTAVAVPADLAARLQAVESAGPPRAVALGADDATVVCWELPAGPGSTALERREALLSPPARWWPVVVVDGSWEEALTEAPQSLEELADLDVEEGPSLLDQRWQAAHGRAEREERLGLHRGTTPAPTVTAVTRAAVDPPASLEGGDVVVVLADGSWQVPAVLGWAPVDGGLGAHDLSAVLQYWQEQWGASLVALSADSFVLRVDDPPTTDDDALAVAQEVLAVAPMLVSADLVEPLPRVAELLAPALLGAGWWHVRMG